MTTKPFIIITITLTFLLSLLSCNRESPTEGPDFFITVFNFETIDNEPDWSPDGKTIAYHHSGNQLMLLDLESMEKRYLTQGRLPDWSPDSRKIAYVLRGNIHIIDVETKQISKLTQWGSCFFPSWSPDGKMIAYDAITSSAVPVDSAGIWIISAESLAKKLVLAGRIPDWSPDATKLVYYGPPGTATGTESQIWVASIDGTNRIQLTKRNRTNADPSWSPDGGKIAWVSAGPGNDPASGIWVMDADGSNQHLIAQWSGQPSWSPDGSQIVYYGFNFDPDTGTLWLMNADGTNQRPLTTP